MLPQRSAGLKKVQQLVIVALGEPNQRRTVQAFLPKGCALVLRRMVEPGRTRWLTIVVAQELVQEHFWQTENQVWPRLEYMI